MQDIADQLNISQTTVSRSLRHDKVINPETRALVNETARRMGYKQRTRAGRPRGSRKSETRNLTLGLLLRATSVVAAQQDLNLMKMMAGIMTVADEQGVLLKVDTAPPLVDGSIDGDVVARLGQGGVCQALIAHGEHPRDELTFLSNRMPVVSMGRIYADLPIDAAVADNLGGTQALVHHLVELGHRRLAWVGAFYRSSFMDARQAGFLQGCLEHGLTLSEEFFFGAEIYEDHDIVDKDALLRAVQAGVTGFVCGNDTIAIGVTTILREAGLSVPGDVSVTGFDAWVHPDKLVQPTTIDPGFFEIGQVAARLALQRIARPIGRPCVVNVRGKMVVGETTAPPA